MDLFFDIETIPGNHPSEAIAAMAAKREDEPVKFAATSPWLCEVKCISYWTEHDGMVSLVNRGADDAPIPARDRRRYFGSEFLLLDFFNNETLKRARRLITFAGRMFDLPTLYHRSLASGVRPSYILSEAVNEYRFKPCVNLDLQEILTFFGATCRRPSLREVCLGYGLPDPKANGDGGNVKDMVLDDIATYCEGDVTAVIRIYEILMGKRLLLPSAASLEKPHTSEEDIPF